MAINVSFPINKPVIRGPVNEADKATIFSIYPKPLDEYKHTLFPGHWQVEAGSYEHPTRLVVGPSSWFFDKDEESPIIEVPVGAVQIAKSIVDDYAGACLESSLGSSQPGLFFVPGDVPLSDLKTRYKDKFEQVNILQKNWFSKLVRIADSLWARSNGNPIAISDDMRLAASMLGLEDKTWMQDFTAVGLQKCVACGNLRNPDYPICPTCKNIDINHPKSKELKFAV